KRSWYKDNLQADSRSQRCASTQRRETVEECDRYRSSRRRVETRDIESYRRLRRGKEDFGRRKRVRKASTRGSKRTSSQSGARKRWRETCKYDIDKKRRHPSLTAKLQIN